MKSVYFKSGMSEWRYALDDEEFESILAALRDEDADLDAMFDDSLEILRDHSALTEEEEMDEDDLVDQAISIAVVWQHFNTLPLTEGGIRGDIALVEEPSGDSVSAYAAAEVIEEPPRRNG